MTSSQPSPRCSAMRPTLRSMRLSSRKGVPDTSVPALAIEVLPITSASADANTEVISLERGESLAARTRCSCHGSGTGVALAST
jgi:hypothetical protein